MTLGRKFILKQISECDIYTPHELLQWHYRRENEERDEALKFYPSLFLSFIAFFLLLVIIPLMTVNFDCSKVKEAVTVAWEIINTSAIAIVISFVFIAIQETVTHWNDE